MKLRGLVPNSYINVSTSDLFISTFLGPKWHSPNGSRTYHRAQKSLDFQDPTPLPLALVMYLPASKALRTAV